MAQALSPGFRSSLLIVLLVNVVLASAGALYNANLFSSSAWAVLGTLLLLSIGFVGVIATAAVWRRTRQWIGSSVAVLLVATLAAGYGLVREVQSPVLDPWVTVSAAAIFLANAWLFATILTHAPTSVSGGWVVVTALFPLVGFVQLWIEGVYLPYNDIPQVDITAEVTADESSERDALRITVTLVNRGDVHAIHVGSLLQLRGMVALESGIASSAPSRNDPDPGTGSDPVVTIEVPPPNPLLQENWFDHGGRQFRVDRAHPAEAPLLVDELLPPESLLTPGESWSTTRIVQADLADYERAELIAEAAFVAEREVGPRTTCLEPVVAVNELSPQSALSVEWGEEAIVARSFCVRTPLIATSLIDAITHDDQAVYANVFVEDDEALRPTPYLSVMAVTSDEFGGADDQELRTMHARVRARSPYALVGAASEIAVP